MALHFEPSRLLLKGEMQPLSLIIVFQVNVFLQIKQVQYNVKCNLS